MATLSLAGLLIWLMLVMVIDFRTRKIPNLLSLGSIAFAVMVLLMTGKTLSQEPVSAAIAGFLAGLALTLPGYATRTLGAGDVKLLAGIGLLLGLQAMIQTWVLASLGVLAFMLLQPGLSIFGFNAAVNRPKKYIPYGAALAVALILILLFPDVLGLDKWKINETFFY